MKKPLACLSLLLLSLAVHAGQGPVVRSSPSSRAPIGLGKLTLDQAVQIALQRNADIQKAIHEIERTKGLVIEVRAQALPHVGITGSYNQQDRRLLERSSGSSGTDLSGVASALSEGSPQQQQAAELLRALGRAQQQQGGSVIGDKTWEVRIEARQAIYTGGQISAAMRITRFTEDSAYFSLRDVINRVISDIRKQFYDILLNRELITVQEESVRLLEVQLADQQNRFDAGAVPRFNVLQAEVALANARPDLIRARNNYLVSLLTLAKTIGVETSRQPDRLPFEPVGELQARPEPFGLATALNVAKERRSFLKIRRLQILIETHQIKVEIAGYKPRLDLSGGYEVRNSSASDDLSDTVNGWFFGITGSWNIFDGFETHGRVKQARARLEQAKATYDDSVQQVELEVQTAFSQLNQARETVASQRRTVEQALEAVRLAQERLALGAGTQLELLDVQVALTRSRSTELQARRDYAVALAELERATELDTRYDDTFKDPLVQKTNAGRASRLPKVDGNAHRRPQPEPPVNSLIQRRGK